MANAPRLRSLSKAARNTRSEGDSVHGPWSKDTGRPTLLSFDEMPQWFRYDNNVWVLHGYRPISNSACASFGSWWYAHNETVNIYSHLIPAVVFPLGQWYIIRYLADRYPGVTSIDFLAFSCFILTATICFATSTVYHTLMNHSYAVDHFCHRLDMAGIGIFIIGDIILGVHIIFWCETFIRNTYWFMVLFLGALTVIINIHPKMQGHDHRSVRILAFVVTGVSIVAPLMHGLKMFGLALMYEKALTYTLVAKIGYLLPGTALYAIRFPESWWPGKFDMCSSHSFMHILVVCAALVQLIGYLKAFDYAYSTITCSTS